MAERVERAEAVAGADEELVARGQRRRAMAVVAAPGVAVAVVVVVVLVVVTSPVVAAVAGVASGAAVAVAAWWSATPRLLRALRAEPADEDECARVFNQVEGLCATMGLAIPALWVVADESTNALVVGRRRDDAALVVTAGLARSLDPVQLEGVLAHELAHVKCADMIPATMAAAVALPLSAAVPGLATVVHRVAGRGREFRTDQRAVSVTRYPPGLREALALMVDAGGPRPPSPLAGRGAAVVTRWLWTVALSDPSALRSASAVPGELDDAAVRIAALDEW